MNTITANHQSSLQDSAIRQHYVLRPMEKADADLVARWYQHLEDISIFDRQVPVPINHAEVTKLIDTIVSDRDKEKCVWYIAESAQGDAVGMCGLEAISLLHGHAILPAFVDEKWRKTGVGVRMACLMIDLAFKQLRLHRVSTVYRSDNKASKALIKRCGFKDEGVARQAWFSQGKYYDLINVGLLADEWEKNRVKLRSELNPSVTVSLGPRPSEKWIWPGVLPDTQS